MNDVEVTVTIGASAEALYDMVSDVTRMGTWSPETRRCRWLGGATGPATGARFAGTNKDGWRVWSTVCTVTDATRGKRFAFDVKFGPMPVASWAYDFAPDGDGTAVTESWSDHRPGWFRAIYGPLMNVKDRAAHNRAGMQATLANLQRVAENPS